MILKIKDLKKSFGDKLLFENLNFEIYNNDIVGLVGPSGIGKTTLMNILLGLENFDSGKLEYSEKPRYSVVFQENLLFEERTVLDNLRFVSENNNKNMMYLQKLEIEEYSNFNISDISGGMKRKVALARAMLIDSNIILMDEAIREVDLITRDIMIDFIKEFIGNKPLIYITHNEEDLSLIKANKIIRLNKSHN